jgi:multidrug efflux pump subunit AcrB
MKKFIQFFLEKSKLTLFLLISVYIIGVINYRSMPKEIFPVFALDKISVIGGYPQTNADTLNNIFVEDFEKEAKNLEGIKTLDTTIKNNSFSVFITLDRNTDKNKLKNDIDTLIDRLQTNLPSDMSLPVSSILDKKIPLIYLYPTFNNVISEMDSFIKADELKTSLLKQIPELSSIQIFGYKEPVIKITLNINNIKAYDLDVPSVFKRIKEEFSIYSFGKLEQKDNHFYISPNKFNNNEEVILNSNILVNGKNIKIRDIANIEKNIFNNYTASFSEHVPSFVMKITKKDNADSLEVVEKINSYINDNQNEEMSLHTIGDSSLLVVNRFNTVSANIITGFLMVIIILVLFVHKRVSFIVSLGIPTAIFIGFSFLNILGYSINLMTLLGILISLGMLVDEAIIISENIYQNIEKGYEKKKAILIGVTEVFPAVLAGMMTTLLAFLPILTITGEVGEFIKLIPITISILLVSSIIEGLIFLPYHAQEFLNIDTNNKTVSKFEPFKQHYKKILTFILNNRIKFLITFISSNIIILFISASFLQFNLIPKYDNIDIFINGSFPINNNKEENKQIINKLTAELATHKEYEIKSIVGSTGYKIDGRRMKINGNNNFFIYLNLKDRAAQNVIEKYINPVLQIYGKSEMVRISSTDNIVSQIEKDVISKYVDYFKEVNVFTPSAGISAADIEFSVSGELDKVEKAISELIIDIKNNKNIRHVSSDIEIGEKELILNINQYGKKIGLTYNILANNLLPIYFEKDYAKTFDDGISEIVFTSDIKNKYEYFKTIELKINNKFYLLKDLVELNFEERYDKLYKYNNNKIFTVSAFLSNDSNITGNKFFSNSQTKFKDIEKKYKVKIFKRGSAEKTKDMISDIKLSLIISFIGMLLILLLTFNSFSISFLLLSTIPFSIVGIALGHTVLGLNLSVGSVIGILGAFGVVLNDSIVMMEFIRKSTNKEELLNNAVSRMRPIILTTVTTFVGLSTLMFFATGQSKILEPTAVSLGFGLIWGTFVSLFYLPVIYTYIKKIKD